MTRDDSLDVTAFGEPDTLFGMSPDWTSLSDADTAAAIEAVRRMDATSRFFRSP